jgi:hypothetical protein
MDDGTATLATSTLRCVAPIKILDPAVNRNLTAPTVIAYQKAS